MGPFPTFSFSSAVQKYVMLHPLHDVGLCESTNVVDDLRCAEILILQSSWLSQRRSQMCSRWSTKSSQGGLFMEEP